MNLIQTNVANCDSQHLPRQIEGNNWPYQHHTGSKQQTLILQTEINLDSDMDELLHPWFPQDMIT